MGYGTRREAEREAFKAVPETCPDVSAAEHAASTALDALGKASLKAREALRAGLIEAYEAKIEAEEALEKANDRIAELEKKVEELQEQIENMEEV